MGFFIDTALAQVATQKALEKGGELQDGVVAKIAEMLGFFFTRIPAWIAAALVFVLSIGAAKIIRRAVENRIAEKIDEEHQEVLVLAGRISYVGSLTLGITISLKIAGIDLTTILAAIAFGIGFALRDLIMNFIAGIMILVSRHFVIGDFIKVGDRVGKVVEIQSRATILTAIDGTKVIVPNSEIFSSSVVSFTSNPMRRVMVPLYVAYGTDLDYTIKIALRVLKSHPKIMKKPGPSVVIKDYGDSSIDLMSRFWVTKGDNWFKVRSDIIKMMDKAFTEAGIHVPYDVMHIETSSDISREIREEIENERKMKEVLAMEAARKKEAKKQQGAAGVPPTESQPTPSNGNVIQPLVLAPVTVSVEGGDGASLSAVATNPVEAASTIVKPIPTSQTASDSTPNVQTAPVAAANFPTPEQQAQAEELDDQE